MNTTNIIGRIKELGILSRLYDSNKSEFLAIYGRRRVGKSYLIDEALRDQMVFSTVGIFRKPKRGEKKSTFESTYRKLQLSHFHQSLLDYGLDPSYAAPVSWLEAFSLLKHLLSQSTAKRKVVFIDELPWLAGTQSSELVEELGFFWNNWAVKQRNIFIIVCGSATSWMLDNVIRDYGGLHSRLTEKFLLKPFTLSECRQYFGKRGFLMSDYEIALCYMALGGIPYYLDKLQRDQTLTQNIDSFYFRNDSIAQEFEDVYTGLFSSSERYINVVKALSRKFYGMTRSEICDSVKIKGGGTFTKMIDNLKACGIIREYVKYGGARKVKMYQLKDFFSLFYLNFVDLQKGKTEWKSFLRTDRYQIWAGHAFELLCSDHLAQLQEALRIKNVGFDYCWSGVDSNGKGAQIDLVIPAPNERTDYVCELKFSENSYSITDKYAEELRDKLAVFRMSKNHKPSHSVLLVMVTSMGLKNSANNGAISASVTLADLFAL